VGVGRERVGEEEAGHGVGVGVRGSAGLISL
jgi:hypothetical protein